MALYKQYANTNALATLGLSNLGGIEILDIKYGIDDYAIACFNYGCGRIAIRKHKIYTTPAGRSYIRKYGTRYYFDQIMKVR